jgi:hypothetical protein
MLLSRYPNWFRSHPTNRRRKRKCRERLRRRQWNH